MDEVARLKSREKSLIWGKVISQKNNHLDIEMDIDIGSTMYGQCPMKYLGQHERHQFNVGDLKAFHLRRVESVMVGNIPRTKITLDRVSKRLVECLIKDEVPKYQKEKISCQVRYVGKKSFVTSTVFLPKRAILKTSQELGEHIQVKVNKEA